MGTLANTAAVPLCILLSEIFYQPRGELSPLKTSFAVNWLHCVGVHDVMCTYSILWTSQHETSVNLIVKLIGACNIRTCTVMFNVEAFEMFKRGICKNIVESSLREETLLARNPGSNRRLTSHCRNSPSVISIRYCTSTFTSLFIKRLHL